MAFICSEIHVKTFLFSQGSFPPYTCLLRLSQVFDQLLSVGKIPLIVSWYIVWKGLILNVPISNNYVAVRLSYVISGHGWMIYFHVETSSKWSYYNRLPFQLGRAMEDQTYLIWRIRVVILMVWNIPYWLAPLGFLGLFLWTCSPRTCL